MEMNYHLLFKILLVGDVEVGRSALPHPSASETPSSTPNIGVEFLKKTVEIGKYKRWSCDTTGAFLIPLIIICKQLGNSGNYLCSTCSFICIFISSNDQLPGYEETAVQQNNSC